MFINVNDRVRIKVTPVGMALIESERRTIKERGTPGDHSRYMEPDADGYLETSLWTAMYVFDIGFVMGCEPPFMPEVEVLR